MLCFGTWVFPDGLIEVLTSEVNILETVYRQFSREFSVQFSWDYFLDLDSQLKIIGNEISWTSNVVKKVSVLKIQSREN